MLVVWVILWVCVGGCGCVDVSVGGDRAEKERGNGGRLGKVAREGGGGGDER